ncbi:MAG: OmpA family protein [Bacteroidetes bacterium]|nr:OmpA family protein [Bacteroidota bacterium]
MKFFVLSIYAILFSCSTLFGQKEIKTFLLNKEEYKYFETNNLLVTKAIENAFGSPNKQNFYKLDINQVDAWNDKVNEFKYYPATNGDPKKPLLKSTVVAAKENTAIKLRVTINPEKSTLNDAITLYLDAKNSFVLNLVVVGDAHIRVSEAVDKTAFLTIIDEKSFTEKAFKNFFGENPKKQNYNIMFENMTACLVKNIISGACAEQFNGASYDKFAEKVTTAEYSASFILIDLHIIREKSTLTPAIEAAVIKEADGTEHLKFYFCIPKDNIRPKKKKDLTIEGKIISGAKLPVKGLTIYLRDASNSVIATETTDNSGLFKFEKLKEGLAYSLFIDNSCKESSLFLYDKKDVMVGQYKKTDIGYEYKLMDADIVRLSDIQETDPTLDFQASVKGRMLSVTDKINPISNQLIELKNSGNQVIQSQKTDGNGNFAFTKIDPKANYSIELPNYVAVSKIEKVYLANAKNELIKEFKRDANNKFSYKIVPADMHLLSTLDETDVEMTFTSQKNANKKEIVIHDFIYFNLNSFQISPQSKPTLDKIAKLVNENPAYKMDIISHTDSRGETAENQKLSEKRSISVMNYLITKSIEAKRLKSVGMGESKPLNNCVDGASCLEDEYKMNRRTEFRFYK